MLTAALVVPWLLAAVLAILLLSNRRRELWRRNRLLRLEVAHQMDLVKRARRERDAARAALGRNADGRPATEAVKLATREIREEESCRAH